LHKNVSHQENRTLDRSRLLFAKSIGDEGGTRIAMGLSDSGRYFASKSSSVAARAAASTVSFFSRR
jgi:hypothetical protein